MAIFSKMLEVFLSILLFCLMACGTIEHSCQWSMDVLEMSSKPEKKFYVSDNVIYPGRSYFLRIRPSCENQIYPFLLRSLVFTGYTPHIKLEVLKYGLESVTKTRLILYTEGVLVQFNQSSSVSVLQGNFLLLDDSEFIANPTYKNCPVGQRSSEKIPQAIEENLSSPQCSDSRLCNVAWFVPLSVEELPVVIKCSVTNPLMMEEKSLIVHSIGPRKPSGNRIGEHISSLPDGYVIDKTFNINRLALPTPFWVISALRPSDYCLLTDSEFETTSLIKVHNISQAGRPKVCPEPCSDDEIKGTLSLPDRILLATCFGLQEIQTTLENYHSEVILPYCIIKLVTPPQSFPGNIKILAIEESSARVFESKLDQG